MAKLHDEDTEADFQRFLRRVDDVTNLLQGLSSPDRAVKDKAIAEAEGRLRDGGTSTEEETKTTVNRTVINTRAPGTAEAENAALKEKGNDAFRRGDFARAIQSYTEGLQQLRDKQELYTNRAQAYLKIQEYEKAIGDCEWALKSRQCYEKILQIDPRKESLFKDCVNEVNLEEKRMKDEEKAMKEVECGNVAALSIKELLHRLGTPGQELLFYTGGIRILAEVMKDCTGQTLFRTNKGFSILRDNEAVRGWLQILMAFVKCSDARAGSAMNILSDLIGEERFKAQCQVLLSTGVLPLFTQLLASARLVNQAALAHAIGTMGSLCAEPGARGRMAESRECWQGCLELLDESLDGSTPSYQECVFAVLGLMMNLLLESNGIIQHFAVDISGRCLALLSHQDGRIVTAGGQLTARYGTKTLGICTKSNRQAQEDLVKADKGFTVLLRLLQSEEEMVVGNAAFCLSQCLGVPGAGTALLGSNVVQLLLSLAGGDATRPGVQENAAIALGKLCAAEPRHIHQLRKLNGLAILNSSMKYVHS
ncbi:tetratricopeptide repeat domain 12 [Willisornis vidua]|uniref:Tetratricopeptide repeat domain 12 n=1 Tax=Willisornis vidua TaxID=1566151 RepID=A0ABQ9DTV1_9PASS|nr:tetratricopeptide repeat domain 12 [Willisornis vidua]